MTSPVSLANLAQVTWDEIVDHLGGSGTTDMTDLKSIALTHRRFLTRAQSHLFNTIHIPVLRLKAEAKEKRLLHLMTSSAHLIRHVRALYIFCQEAAAEVPLHHLSQVPWSHLNQLALAPVPTFSGSSCLASMTFLLKIPSLRTLYFLTGQWDAVHIHNIFSRCASSITRISFAYCHICRESACPAKPLASLKPTQIDVFSSPSMVDALLELDLSSVTELRCNSFDSPRFNCALWEAVNSYLDDLDPSLLPSLTQIDAFPPLSNLTYFLARLPAGNRLATINLFPISFQGNTIMEDLESVLLTPSMAALRDVSIRTHPRSFKSPVTPVLPSWREIVSFYEGRFPRLHERGMLSVRLLPAQEELFVKW